MAMRVFSLLIYYLGVVGSFMLFGCQYQHYLQVNPDANQTTRSVNLDQNRQTYSSDTSQEWDKFLTAIRRPNSYDVWYTLPLRFIQNVCDKLPKFSERPESSWVVDSSAANAAATALVLCNISFGNNWDDKTYRLFLASYPENNESALFTPDVVLPLVIGSIVAIPVPVTMPVAVSLIGMVKLMPLFFRDKDSPIALSAYINKYVLRAYNEDRDNHKRDYFYTQVCTYSEFKECEQAISASIKDKTCPVIVCIPSYTDKDKWSYLNIVAVKEHTKSHRMDNENSKKGFMLLDADKNFEYISYNALDLLMFQDHKPGLFCKAPIKHYTIIRFGRIPKAFLIENSILD